jgi:hypothetical protein
MQRGGSRSTRTQFTLGAESAALSAFIEVGRISRLWVCSDPVSSSSGASRVCPQDDGGKKEEETHLSCARVGDPPARGWSRDSEVPG